MLKKIALGALMTGLVAVLVVGAVNRTNAVSGDANGTTGRHGQTAYTETEPLAQGNGGRWSTTQQEVAGRGGQGGAGYVETEPLAQGGGGRWKSAQQETTGRGGRWAQESGAGQTWGGGANEPLADVQPSEWNTLQGTVISATDDLIEVETEAGVIPFEGQPLRFALAQGFSAEVGDELSLSGYDEDGEFKIGSVTNLSSGATVTLRDTTGRPGWSGGRRG